MQFETPLDLEITDLGVIRSFFKNAYPGLETHPPLGRMRLPVDGRSLTVSVVNDGVGAPRLWFLNEEGNRLVQLQSDRIAVNWRRRLDEAYPRYTNTVRPMMQNAIDALTAAMESLGKPLPMPDIGEVLYINPIEAGEGFATAGQIGDVISLWGGPSDGFLPQPVEARLAATYAVLDGGFLNIEVTPAQKASNGSPVLMTKLLVRAPIRPQTVDGAFKFFDAAREWVVRGFTSTTTSKMHTIWGRTE
jgi:uncharacterized protein (TIGR04255 family)